jgi:hypothetical protein
MPGPQVRVLNATDLSPRFDLTPFPQTGFPPWKGEVRVAVGDVTGDGIPEVLCTPGFGGGPMVRIYDSATGALVPLHSSTILGVGGFFTFPLDFGGGVSLAVGDVDGDGTGEIVCAAGFDGGPHVRVVELAAQPDGTFRLAEVGSFFAYDLSFDGGVSVAVGDFTGDGADDIITGTLRGAAHVRVFDGKTFQEVRGFYAFDPSFLGGTFVTAADLDGDGKAEVIAGAGEGGGPHVKVFKDIATVAGLPFDGAPYGLVRIADFFADDVSLRGGVRVMARDLDGDGLPELMTAAGTAPGTWGGTGTVPGVDRVRVFDPSPLAAAITEPVNRPPSHEWFGFNDPTAAIPGVVNETSPRGVRAIQLPEFAPGLDPDSDPVTRINPVVLDPRTRIQRITATSLGNAKYRIDLSAEEEVSAVVTSFADAKITNPSSTWRFPVVLGSVIQGGLEAVNVRVVDGDVRPWIVVSNADDRGGSSVLTFRLSAESVRVSSGTVLTNIASEAVPEIGPEIMDQEFVLDDIGQALGTANLVPTRALTASERDEEGLFAAIGVQVDGLYVG